MHPIKLSFLSALIHFSLLNGLHTLYTSHHSFFFFMVIEFGSMQVVKDQAQEGVKAPSFTRYLYSSQFYYFLSSKV